jgi:hypothetical protein
MAKLKNLTRRIRSFNLEHPTFVNQQGANGLGKPEALTLLPLEVKEVHADALICREIKGALNPLKGRPTLRVLA